MGRRSPIALRLQIHRLINGRQGIEYTDHAECIAGDLPFRVGVAWIVPTPVCSDQRISLLRSPGPRFVSAHPMMVLENLIDHLPGGFDRIFARKKASIALHRVTQKPLVRRLLSRLFFQKKKLSLLSDIFLPRELDASGERDRRVWRESKAKVVSLARSCLCIGKKPLRRRLQLHENLRRGSWQIFART